MTTKVSPEEHGAYLLQRMARLGERSTLSLRGCWEWTGSSVKGYGQFSVADGAGRTKNWKTHRFAYTMLVDDIPPGLEIDHLCRNTLCWNPDHLEPVPRRVNILRSDAPSAMSARRTHCVRGHSFAEHGGPRKGGGRYCRVCARAKRARQRARLK